MPTLRRSILSLCVLVGLILAPASPAGADAPYWSKPALPFPEGTKVRAMRADPGGYLWVIAAQSRELAVLDFQDGILSLSGGDLPGSAPFSDAAFEEIAGTWLVGGDGLVRISKEGQRKSIPLEGISAAAPFNGAIVSSPGVGMIVTVPGHGLAIYGAGGGETVVRRGEGLASASFCSRPAVSDRKIWVATSDAGLLTVSPDGKAAEKPAFPLGAAWPPICDLTADWADNLWIATNSGLYRAKGGTILKVQYPGEDAAVKALTVRGSQEIWVLLESGRLLVYNPLFGWLPREAAYPGAIGTPTGPMEGNTRGDLWLMTVKGLHHLPGSPAATPGETVSKVWALKVACETPANSAFRLSLPVDSGAPSLWFWGAFVVDGGASAKGSGDYAVEDRPDGSRSVTIAGGFTSIEYYSGLSAVAPPPTPLPVSCPFPATFPEAVKEYLLPGAFIPSDDKQIVDTAESFVKPASRGDMALTVRDLVYSGLFRDMAVDFLDPFTAITFERKGAWPFNREAGDVLKSLRGDSSGKSRLLCSLCRARGIPSRVVRRSDGLYAWCEVWLNEAGWVAADVTAPLFALSSTKRPQLPKDREAADFFAAYPSGRDDEAGVLTVTSGGKCTVSSGDLACAKDPARLGCSRLLVFRPCAGGAPRWEARMPLTAQLSAYMVREKWGARTLVIGNRDRTVQSAWPLLNPGKTITCAIPGHVLLKGVPRVLRNLVVFEVQAWESWE